jgi:hypothetical protein
VPILPLGGFKLRGWSWELELELGPGCSLMGKATACYPFIWERFLISSFRGRNLLLVNRPRWTIIQGVVGLRYQARQLTEDIQ